MPEAEKPWMPVAMAGRWRDMYGRDTVLTVDDLRRLAANYDPAVEKAPLFLDAGWHESRSGDAAGWVESLRVNGEFLEAQVKDVPPEVREAVAAGRRKYVSSELLMDKDGLPQRLIRV
ncbi:MAG: hypothetical protein AB1896_21585, partial [Thermodesulfobacteriota bacterium]